MYQKNTMKLEKLKSNMNFLDGRIQEISDYISKQEESNQTVSPVTLSILELNKEMRAEVEKELSGLDQA